MDEITGVPEIIADDEYKVSKWQELTNGAVVNPLAVPQLVMLVNWYAILEQCIRDISDGGETHVAYVNDHDDVKPMPQIAIMKQASSEIRALTKLLYEGDKDSPPLITTKPQQEKLEPTPLERVRARHLSRVEGASSAGKKKTRRRSRANVQSDT